MAPHRLEATVDIHAHSEHDTVGFALEDLLESTEGERITPSDDEIDHLRRSVAVRVHRAGVGHAARARGELRHRRELASLAVSGLRSSLSTNIHSSSRM